MFKTKVVICFGRSLIGGFAEVILYVSCMQVCFEAVRVLVPLIWALHYLTMNVFSGWVHLLS